MTDRSEDLRNLSIPDKSKTHPKTATMDPGAKALLDEVTALIANHLERGDAHELVMFRVLDAVPMSIILLACDQLGVTVRGGVWRVRQRA